MVFDAQGKSDGGLGPAEVADRLIAAGADVIGANCGIGPAELYPSRSAWSAAASR
jgi:methionine synthase I (cobalamin-dependent)